MFQLSAAHAAQGAGRVVVTIRAVKSAVNRRRQAGSSPGVIAATGAGVMTICWQPEGS
jgi:hypothetical protein